MPFDAVVGSAEVKLMNHDAEVCSCDSRFRMMSNVSQISKVKKNVIFVSCAFGCIAWTTHGRCLLWV